MTLQRRVVTENNGAESYLTYAGDVAIGFDTPKDGNVAEQAPVDAGSYVVTLTSTKPPTTPRMRFRPRS